MGAIPVTPALRRLRQESHELEGQPEQLIETLSQGTTWKGLKMDVSGRALPGRKGDGCSSSFSALAGRVTSVIDSGSAHFGGFIQATGIHASNM